MVTTNKNALKHLEENRIKAIDLNLKGVQKMEIVKQVKLSWKAVQKAIELYEEGGYVALKPQPRGRHKGVGRVLSPEQEAEILTIICHYQPSQYAEKYQNNSEKEWNHGLWNMQLVKSLIQQLTNISLSNSSVTQYVERWGLLKPYPDGIDSYPWSKETRNWWQDHSKNLLETIQSKPDQLYFLIKTRITAALPEGSKKYWVINVINRKGEQYWWVCPGLFSHEKQKKLLITLMKNTQRKAYVIVPNTTFFGTVKLLSYLEKTQKSLKSSHIVKALPRKAANTINHPGEENWLTIPSGAVPQQLKILAKNPTPHQLNPQK